MKTIYTDKRRSQRLFIQVPVVVESQPGNEPKFSETTRTLVVNAHGALVESSTLLDQGQTLILRNLRTNEQQESVVKLVSPGDPGKFNVALEFTNPNPNFWHINFPPEDWSTRRMHANRTP